VDSAAKEKGVERIDANFIRGFYDRVVPGIYKQFDGPVMLPLIAPRPLLVINGDSDDRTPLVGLAECVDAARKAYRASNAGEKFSFRLQENTGHKVTPESLQTAVDWFVNWLKP
jgi:predicted esterase